VYVTLVLGQAEFGERRNTELDTETEISSWMGCLIAEDSQEVKGQKKEFTQCGKELIGSKMILF
jgi:hypothetical protein